MTTRSEGEHRATSGRSRRILALLDDGPVRLVLAVVWVTTMIWATAVILDSARSNPKAGTDAAATATGTPEVFLPRRVGVEEFEGDGPLVGSSAGLDLSVEGPWTIVDGSASVTTAASEVANPRLTIGLPVSPTALVVRVRLTKPGQGMAMVLPVGSKGLTIATSPAFASVAATWTGAPQPEWSVGPVATPPGSVLTFEARGSNYAVWLGSTRLRGGRLEGALGDSFSLEAFVGGELAVDSLGVWAE